MNEALIELTAERLYDAWRGQYPGPVTGTTEYPRWFALRVDLKEPWRQAVRSVFARADARRAEQ